MAGEVPGIREVIKNLSASAVKQREKAALKDLKAHLSHDPTCRALDRATSDGLDSDQYSVSSWPSLIKALLRNILTSLEGQKNKRKALNKGYLTILRTAVMIPIRTPFYLWDCIPELYDHLATVMMEYPDFRDAYAGILASLFNTAEYRFEMAEAQYKGILNSLLDDEHSSDNALLSIIQKPPVHLTNPLIAKLSVRLSLIFAKISARGDARKPLEAVLGLLSYDGPNFGDHLLKFHPTASKALIGIASKTLDLERGLVIQYFRTQLKLRAVKGDNLTGLFDFLEEELTRQNACELPFLLLASDVIFETSKQTSEYWPNDRKRRKKMQAYEIVIERLNDSKYFSWTGAVCLLIKQYYSDLPSQFLSRLLQSLAQRLRSTTREMLQWTIRCLNELCDALICGETSSWNDPEAWQSAWNTLIQIITTRPASPSDNNDAFRLLGCLALKELAPACDIPHSFWELAHFKTAPCKGALFLIACYFSSTPSQCFEVRKLLLKWSITAIQDPIDAKLLGAVFLALSTGFKITNESRLVPNWSDVNPEVAEDELARMDMSEEAIASRRSFVRELNSTTLPQRTCLLEMAQSIELLGILSSSLLDSIEQTRHIQSLEFRLGLCVLVSDCIANVNILRKTRDHGLDDWVEDGKVVKLMLSVLKASTLLLQSIESSAEADKQLTDKAAAELSEFLCGSFDKHVTFALGEFLDALVKLIPRIRTNRAPDAFGFDDASVTTTGRWKRVCLVMISRLCQVLPQTYQSLLDLSLEEERYKEHQELIDYMCQSFRPDADLPKLIVVIKDALEWRMYTDGVCYHVVVAVEKLLLKLQPDHAKIRDEVLDALVNLLGKIKNRTPNLHWRTRSKLGDAMAILNKLHPDFKLRELMFSLLNDPDFRVRIGLGGCMDALFASCEDHRQLLKDIRSNLKVKLPSRSSSAITSETFPAKTVLVLFGDIAAASAEVETEAVFTLLATAALQPTYRSLVTIILDRHAKRLGYPDRWKILEHLLGNVLTFWATSKLELSSLVEIQDILRKSSDIVSFCVPFVLPSLLQQKRVADIRWLAQETSKSVTDLFEAHFPAVYYGLEIYPGQSTDSAVWEITGLNKSTRKTLAKKHIVPILTNILLQVSADNVPTSPRKNDVEVMINDAIASCGVSALDVFKPAHVFELLLSIHKCSSGAMHWRYRQQCLAKLQKLMTLLGPDFAEPGTFRYALHIVLECLDVAELQSKCCMLLREMLRMVDLRDPYVDEQLQSLVSKLVSVIIAEKDTSPSSDVTALLQSVTIEAEASLLPRLKNLDPFPDLPYFDTLREWQSKNKDPATFLTKFVQFVKRAPQLPHRLRLLSLQSFCNQLRDVKSGANSDVSYEEFTSSDEVVSAVWTLTSVCNEEGDQEEKSLIAEFLAVAGFGDPKQFPNVSLLSLYRSEVGHAFPVTTVAHQLVLYLVDKDVSVIQLASTAAKSLFATREGKGAWKTLSSGDQACLKPHNSASGDPPQFKRDMTIDDPLLWSTSGKTHEIWITKLVHSLISYTKNTLLWILQPLVRVKSALAEFLLPYVFAELEKTIAVGTDFHTVISSQARVHVFSESNVSTRSIQLFLLALHKLRVRHVEDKAISKVSKTTKLNWPKVYWLDVDYLLAAKAAERCAAYFSSVLYVEHWCEEKFGHLTLGELPYSEDNKLPEHLKRLLSVYVKINEPDSIYGLHDGQNDVYQVQLSEHEGKWEKALQGHGLLIDNPPDGESASVHSKGVLRALQNLGCSRLSQIYGAGLKSLNEEIIYDKEYKELQYKDAWKSGEWNFSLDLDPLGKELGFNGRLHRSFKFLKDGHMTMFQGYVKQMRQEAVSHVVDNSLESSQSVQPELIKLLMVDCLSTAWNFRWPSTGPPVVPSDTETRYILSFWKDMIQRTNGNYKLLEPLGSCFKILLKVIERDDYVPSLLLESSILARKAGRLSQATAAVKELKRICKLDIHISVAGKIEEAKILRASSQQQRAVGLVIHLLSTLGDTERSISAYCLAGKWLAESRRSSSRIIMQNYLKKSVDIGKTCSTGFLKEKSKSNFHLAQFANSMYRSTEERQNSEEWQASIRYAEVKRKEVETIEAAYKNCTDSNEKQEILQRLLPQKRELLILNADIEGLKNEMATYLKTSLESYENCLLSGDKYDIRVVFRLISLWFNLSTNEEVVEHMSKCIEKVQSHKFIPLVYQIASRIGISKTAKDFKSVVTALLKKMAIEHPYHTLYQIFALANGDRITDSQKKKGVHIVDLDKKQAAAELIASLKTMNAPLINEMKAVIDTYIELAELNFGAKEFDVDKDLPRQLKSRKFSLVPIITANVRVSTDCQYDGIPHFTKFNPRVRVMKGINLPKRVECVDSNGNISFQLVKSGNDDLRQDAVMQQLFGHVNDLLMHYPETRRRSLKLRTYKVVPLTPSAGATEWVSGTVPLSNTLFGLHELLEDGDWTFRKCFEHMMKVASKTPAQKRDAFQEVCEHFRPVFRHFFDLKFLQVTNWFQKRLNYTRSVAASSMVGYVVGLGDRHSANILIDETSAELIHIDFGVAFDQGKTLRIPETIPFRLTRDIIDGMGVTGIEGVFRRCCEATLSVLRSNKEALLTIVEVFIHDPLYRWALSPLQAQRKQQSVQDEDSPTVDCETNHDASRALQQVKWKLEGYEAGEFREAEGQVELLVRSAMDPWKLSRLYPGWGAWM